MKTEGGLFTTDVPLKEREKSEWSEANSDRGGGEAGLGLRVKSVSPKLGSSEIKKDKKAGDFPWSRENMVLYSLIVHYVNFGVPLKI